MANKTALITGGSRGIGFAIAEGLAKDDYDVILVARSQNELDEAKVKIPTSRTFALDVTDIQAVQEMFDQLDHLDILVNAAGVIEPIAPIESVDAKKWLKLLEINVFGTFLITQTAIPLLEKSTNGTIVNFVGGGEGAFPRFSAYAASKGAIARFTETAAAELKDKNITVNAIAPGAVNTKMTEDMIAAGNNAGAQYEKALRQKEMNATPEKAVAVVRWLCSEEARTITGRIISAQWDAFEEFPAHVHDIAKSDIFTVRRILPKDRGFDWE